MEAKLGDKMMDFLVVFFLEKVVFFFLENV